MEPKKRVYISTPKIHMESLEKLNEWHHGLVITGLHPNLSENDVQSYFQEWGTVTECEVKKISPSEFPIGLGYVRYSSQEEAEEAQEAGPHFLAHLQIQVRKVISPKEEEPENIPMLLGKHGMNPIMDQELTYNPWQNEA